MHKLILFICLSLQKRRKELIKQTIVFILIVLLLIIFDRDNLLSKKTRLDAPILTQLHNHHFNEFFILAE